MLGIIETALGNAANQRHLAAFETDADGASRTGRLSLAPAAGRLAVAAGLTLAETLAAMPGTGSWFEGM
jgi:hypothetical protein